MNVEPLVEKYRSFGWEVRRIDGHDMEQVDFRKAFETKLESEYEDEGEDLTIIACGPMVPEAMRAAWILKRGYGYETRVINLHTLKPIDEGAIVWAAKETGVILTAEEHQIGALAWRVSNVITASPRALWSPGYHRGDRGKGSVRRLRCTLGTHQGVRSQRGAHCPQGDGAHAS
jgi:transketolase C-terminal domain/subunit